MNQLYPYQETGADFLAPRGFGFLWDEMGTGKTRTAIRAADKVGARRILVISPAIIRTFWEDEFLTHQEITRPVACVEGFLTLPPGDGVTIVSHDCLADLKRSVPLLWRGAPYDVVIVDENHAFREPSAQRTQCLYGTGHGLFEAASRTWALTGTPIVNSILDLWMPVSGPLRQSIGAYEWAKRHSERIVADPYGDWKPIGVKITPELVGFLHSCALRRTLESLDYPLPPLHVVDVSVPLAPTDMAEIMGELSDWTYDQVQYAIEHDDGLRSEAISRVRQILGLAKASFAAQHIYVTARQAGPTVAFFQHTKVREFLYEALSQAGLRVSWIDGKITRPQLRAAKEWFQHGRLDVLLVQTQAGGVGLSLTRSHRAVIVELPWTSAALQQAIKRIHRIGQAHACTAEILRASGCWLEQVLASVVGQKARASAKLLQAVTTDS